MFFRVLSMRLLAAATMLALLCCCTSMARAQHGGGGPPGGGGGMSGGGGMRSSGAGFPGGPGGPGGGSGDFGRDHGGPPPGNSPDANATTSTMRGGLQLGPAGRWWDDKHFAKDLQLRPDQQRQMDATFETNRAVLLKRFSDLQGEQNRMEALTRAKTLDEGALFSQIDRVAQARADLEKANTHYLLQIRSEMDADQIVRLEQHR